VRCFKRICHRIVGFGYLLGRKGRRGPEARRLILTTRIRAKKRINVRNRRRVRFFVVNKLSKEIKGGELIERGVKMGREVSKIKSKINRVVKNKEIGRINEVG